MTADFNRDLDEGVVYSSFGPFSTTKKNPEPLVTGPPTVGIEKSAITSPQNGAPSIKSWTRKSSLSNQRKSPAVPRLDLTKVFEV